MLGTHGAKYLLKNIFFVIWYIFYIRQGLAILENKAPQWGGDNDLLRGAFLVIYPITLIHLENIRTKGQNFWFKEFFDKFDGIGQSFVIYTVSISVIAFWLINFTGVFVILASVFNR